MWWFGVLLILMALVWAACDLGTDGSRAVTTIAAFDGEAPVEVDDVEAGVTPVRARASQVPTPRGSDRLLVDPRIIR